MQKLPAEYNDVGKHETRLKALASKASFSALRSVFPPVRNLSADDSEHAVHYAVYFFLGLGLDI